MFVIMSPVIMFVLFLRPWLLTPQIGPRFTVAKDYSIFPSF